MLGSFPLFVNEHEKDQASRAMWPSIAKMLWKRTIGSSTNIREYGLLIRPKNVRGAAMIAEYEGLHGHLLSLI